MERAFQEKMVALEEANKKEKEERERLAAGTWMLTYAHVCSRMLTYAPQKKEKEELERLAAVHGC